MSITLIPDLRQVARIGRKPRASQAAGIAAQWVLGEVSPHHLPTRIKLAALHLGVCLPYVRRALKASRGERAMLAFGVTEIQDLKRQEEEREILAAATAAEQLYDEQPDPFEPL
jgi:hypothetical protein